MLCSEQERGWVPRRGSESWLGLMHDVEVLRLPLVFGRAHASITLSEGRSLATVAGGGPAHVAAGQGYVPHDPTSWPPCRAAASTAVMRAGRHRAQFTLERGEDMFFGVIRSGWTWQRRTRSV